MSTRPMTFREKLAYGVIRTKQVDGPMSKQLQAAMNNELQIVLDYIEEVENG